MTVGFIGCGNMGGALAKAISTNKQIKVYISDNNEAKAKTFAEEIGAEATSNSDVASLSDFLFIGVKPSYVKSVADEIRDNVREGAVIVSMAAGVATDKLTAYFGEDKHIIRIMPNTPVKVGCGMTTWCTNGNVEPSNEDKFIAIMAPTGRLDKIPEALIDAACSVAGCGPAFVYMFIEALADGAVKCGLPREKALIYAAETVKGAAETVIATGEHPEALKDAVCSPGGSTIEGVAALERGGFRSAAISAVEKAFEKNKKLG